MSTLPWRLMWETGRYTSRIVWTWREMEANVQLCSSATLPSRILPSGTQWIGGWYLQNWSWSYTKKDNLLPLPRIEIRLLVLPSRILLAIPTELCRLPYITYLWISRSLNYCAFFLLIEQEVLMPCHNFRTYLCVCAICYPVLVLKQWIFINSNSGMFKFLIFPVALRPWDRPIF
jgi:hypothetical protein